MSQLVRFFTWRDFSLGEIFHLARIFTWREFLLGELVCDQLSIDFSGPDLDLQFEFRV